MRFVDVKTDIAFKKVFGNELEVIMQTTGLSQEEIEEGKNA